MKPLNDYSYLRGFNHEPDFNNYSDEQMERELGYAERLGLNSCRLFVPLHFWQQDRDGFLTKLLKFIRLAWSKNISTTPILLMPYFTEGQTPYWVSEDINPEIPGCYFEENYHIGEAYVTDVITLAKDEPGLLFWDVMNEPSWHGFIISVQDETEKARRMDMVWRFVHHFVRLVRKLDPVNALGIGHTFIEDTETSQTGELVDIIIYHDYLETRSRIEASCRRALELSTKYGKPVINNETGCLCRANPYDLTIQIHDEYKIGWYIFKLMIEEGIWQDAHGICYPDGTVRDPAIVAAIRGFFRNRSSTAVIPNINKEKYAQKALAFASEALQKNDDIDMLEAAEYIANMLECAELVPMANPPTTMIAALRSENTPDKLAIRRLLYDLIKILKDVCQIL